MRGSASRRSVLVAGTLATLDVFDCGAPLPWMADRPAWVEVLTGVVAAFVIVRMRM